MIIPSKVKPGMLLKFISSYLKGQNYYIVLEKENKIVTVYSLTLRKIENTEFVFPLTFDLGSVRIFLTRKKREWLAKMCKCKNSSHQSTTLLKDRQRLAEIIASQGAQNLSECAERPCVGPELTALLNEDYEGFLELIKGFAWELDKERRFVN